MRWHPKQTVILVLGSLPLGFSGAAMGHASPQDSGGSTARQAPDFLDEVQPILAEACFDCHGPDEAVRKGRLRLDVREGLFGDRGGEQAVTPGDLQASLLWARITDDEDPMPPAEHLRQLGDEERDVLRRWIEAGAPFEEHWAFSRIRSPERPDLEDPTWVRDPLDQFVLEGLREAGVRPAEQADPAAWLRRVTLDLTGLPPTPQDLDQFLADPSEAAHEMVVDRLLDSDAHAEHQARLWLDVARYADSNGDGTDGSREMWRWRDWVIEAFRSNKSYDQFLTEQLAGDLLPEATVDQQIATGFLRNHPIFTKAGALEDEYRHAYVVDRVNTVGTAFMGLTLGCAQCHDHKYDPITQREYFGLYDFFNHASERDVGRGRGNTRPVIRLPQGEDVDRLARVEGRLPELEARLESANEDWDAAFDAWVMAQHERARWAPEWAVLKPTGMLSLGGAALTSLEDGSILAEGWNPGSDTYQLLIRPGKRTLTALRLEVLPHESHVRGGVGRSERGTFSLTELEVYVCTEASGDAGDRVRFIRGEDDVALERRTAADLAVDGSERSSWSVFTEEATEAHEAIFLPEEPIELGEQTLLRVVFDHSAGMRSQRNAIGRFRLSATEANEVRRHYLPVEPDAWHALGPFPSEGPQEAHEQVFEPETTIEGGVDLDAVYEAPKPPRKGKGQGPGTGRDANPEAESGPGGTRAKKGPPAGGVDSPRDRAAGAARAGADQRKEQVEEQEKPARTQGKAGERASAKMDRGEKPKASGMAGGMAPAKKPADEEDRDGFDPDLADFFGGEVPEEFGGGGSRGRRDGKLRWEKKEDWRDGSSFRLDGKNAAWYLARTLETEGPASVRLWIDGGDALKVWLDGALVHERDHIPAPEKEEGGSSGGGGFFGFFGGGFDPDFDPDPKDPDGYDRAPVSYGDGVDLELTAGEHEIVLKVSATSRASVRVRLDPLGASHLPLAIARAVRERVDSLSVEPTEAPVGVSDGGAENRAAPEQSSVAADVGARRTANEDEVEVEAEDYVPEWAQVELPDPRAERARQLREWYRSHVVEESKELVLEAARLRDLRNTILGRAPTVMVMNDDRPRTTHLLLRGSWDQPGEVVEAHTPAVLPPLATQEGQERATRLDLARWLTSPEHPLTARVAVNRLWAQHFGEGLVRSLGDFGVRGERPSHPGLLDHLAASLLEAEWDLRALQRRIVLSATYRQSSRARPELDEIDPSNVLLAHAPRRRLSAEGVRDAALAAAGLLNPKVGGKSIKPYQPEGLWDSIGKGGGRYTPSKGEDQYRRGLYVFWKRGVLHPSLSVFDAPSRAVCTVDRDESNTPLQALVLLNDPIYVEAGRALGERMLDEGGSSDGTRLTTGFRLTTSRLPSPEELSTLLRVLKQQRSHWGERVKEASEYLAVGQRETPQDLEPAELAAWASVGQLLLNLDAALHLD